MANCLFKGVARGLDEGLISGTIAQPSFKSEYHLNVDKAKTNANLVAQKTGNITAMVQIGSVAGALVAFLVSDRVERSGWPYLGYAPARPCLDCWCHYLCHR